MTIDAGTEATPDALLDNVIVLFSIAGLDKLTRAEFTVPVFAVNDAGVMLATTGFVGVLPSVVNAIEGLSAVLLFTPGVSRCRMKSIVSPATITSVSSYA